MTEMAVWKATGFGRASNFEQFDMAVVASSRAEAARIMGVSASWLAKYGSSVGSCPEACAKPGTLFVRPAGAFTAPYRRA
jgi:hypothetical protein